jgi:hypothetical protein
MSPTSCIAGAMIFESNFVEFRCDQLYELRPSSTQSQVLAQTTSKAPILAATCHQSEIDQSGPICPYALDLDNRCRSVGENRGRGVHPAASGPGRPRLPFETPRVVQVAPYVGRALPAVQNSAPTTATLRFSKSCKRSRAGKAGSAPGTLASNRTLGKAAIAEAVSSAGG